MEGVSYIYRCNWFQMFFFSHVACQVITLCSYVACKSRTNIKIKQGQHQNHQKQQMPTTAIFTAIATATATVATTAAAITTNCYYSITTTVLLLLLLVLLLLLLLLLLLICLCAKHQSLPWLCRHLFAHEESATDLLTALDLNNYVRRFWFMDVC